MVARIGFSLEIPPVVKNLPNIPLKLRVDSSFIVSSGALALVSEQGGLSSGPRVDRYLFQCNMLLIKNTETVIQ